MPAGSAGSGTTPRGLVVLAGPGDTTDLVANFLSARGFEFELIEETSPSRITMARRRARRVGWPTVVGQILFVTLVQPLERRRARQRIEAIITDAGLDRTPYPTKHLVDSVNDDSTIALLRALNPAVIVVNGTRIISPGVLSIVDGPIINTHAGITPRYRGVHGGYWALAEQHPELVGTTVHLVDQGIDTGGVLAQATFGVTRSDSVATYPYLHLVAGLPLLAAEVQRALDGQPLSPVVSEAPEGSPSRLYLHPTIGQYLRNRWCRGVR